MISQLKAIVGFTEDEPEAAVASIDEKAESPEGSLKDIDADLLKTRIDSLGFSARTAKALANGNVRTLGGLARKKESDIMDIDGLGAKGIQEIKKLLAQHGITLKQ
jgi:DNA-directed RNA polymerase subunit alpha